MKVESSQSQIDITVLGYGNQAAFFKTAYDNTFHEPTKDEPYTEMELPVDFTPGTDLIIDKDAEMRNIEQMKILDKTNFKASSLPINED